jgi:reactive intermediate/imine deaminase
MEGTMNPMLRRLIPLVIVLVAVFILSRTQRRATPAPAAAPAPVTVQYLNADSTPTNLPFSEAVRVGDLLYLSGAVGVKPGTTELVAGGFEAEARQTMENIGATLHRHGSSFGRVVKCTVFLADMQDWPKFNEIYRSFFQSNLPARSALGANGLALGARVEVECIALAG